MPPRPIIARRDLPAEVAAFIRCRIGWHYRPVRVVWVSENRWQAACDACGHPLTGTTL